MFTSANVFALAVQYHQAGQPALAEQLCRQIIQAEPGHADSHHLLGVLAAQFGHSEAAVASISHAVALNPEVADYHSNLGLAYHSEGKLDEAVKHYLEALRLRPDFPEAHTCLGNALHQLGKLEDAVVHCRDALRLQPEYPPALVNLGNALLDQGRIDEAIGCFRDAVRIEPNLAEGYNNLGTAYTRQDKLKEAVECFREAIRLDSRHATAHFNCGTALEAQGRFDEALTLYEEAIRLRPNNVKAHDSLAIALLRAGKSHDAIECCREALRLKPDHLEAKYNLGIIAHEQGNLEEAMGLYEHVWAADHTHVGARFNRGLLWLLQGRWAEGWTDYEWRWERFGFARREFSQPKWDGSSLDGKTILLYAEQGLGDTFQFIRYAQLVKQRGGRVIVECQPRLVRLLTDLPAIDRVAAEGDELPAFDVHASLLSLPGILRTTLASVPGDVPYLHADLASIGRWRSVERKENTESNHSLTPHSALRTPHFLIGIAWQGTPSYHNDPRRSIPLKQFLRLAKVPGVRFISLQKGPGTEQLTEKCWVRSVESKQDQTPHSAPSTLFCAPVLDEESGAFMDTAALMKNLDLVISSDTAVAHLAGALGVPIWLALAHIPDWRWMLQRDDSPWYPSMRLFRQNRAGDWDEVFERIAEELAVVSRQWAVSSMR
jgi:tetratricopeptide (TPR) repeat protein